MVVFSQTGLPPLICCMIERKDNSTYCHILFIDVMAMLYYMLFCTSFLQIYQPGCTCLLLFINSLHAYVCILLQPARDHHPALRATSVDALTDQHWYQTQHLNHTGSATSLGSHSNSSLEEKMQTLLNSGHYQVWPSRNAEMKPVFSCFLLSCCIIFQIIRHCNS